MNRIFVFSRYTVIGAFCALLNNVLLIAFDHFGIGYASAAVLAFGPVVIVGFVLHSRYTFRSRSGWRAFIRYVFAMLVNQPLWFGYLFVMCGLLGLSLSVIGPIGTATFFLINYLWAKWALRARLGRRIAS